MLPPIAQKGGLDSTPKRRKQWGDETKKLIVIKDPIIHSIRKSNYFDADEKVAVVVICKKYDKLRKVEGRSNYQDIEEVE